MGRRHHFVPRFYLTAFSSAPRRIHVLNLDRCRLIADASLRDQCYAHRLYGADDKVERALAQFEGVSAELFHTIRDRRMVPGGGTAERAVLMDFIGLQLARTTAAQTNAMDASRLMADVAFDGSPPPGYDLSPADAMKLTLSMGPMMGATIRDLSATLILSPPGTSFATSDNPAFLYNTYCEGITDSGVTGTQCRGLQIFLPVSPQLLLYLFDAVVYKLSRSTQRFVTATPSDMDRLNRLQLVAAYENVYFNTAALGSQLLESTRAAHSIRELVKPRITRAVDLENDRSELLHQFTPMPQLHLTFSFVAIRASALRLPLFDRARQVRDPYEAQRPQADTAGSATRTFAVKSRHSA